MVNGTFVIDAHCHIYPEKIAARAVAGTDAFYGTTARCPQGTVAELLDVGARAGTDHFIVQSVATTPKQVRSINEFIAASVAQSGGTLTGLFSTGGPPIVLYLTNATDDPKVYFAATQFYFAVTSLYATGTRAINGIITWELLLYALIGMVGCLLGNLLGKFVFERFNGKQLKTVIYIAMIVSGVLMLL